MDNLISYAYESPLDRDRAVTPRDETAEFNPFPLEQVRPVTAREALAHRALQATFADRGTPDY